MLACLFQSNLSPSLASVDVVNTGGVVASVVLDVENRDQVSPNIAGPGRRSRKPCALPRITRSNPTCLGHSITDPLFAEPPRKHALISMFNSTTFPKGRLSRQMPLQLPKHDVDPRSVGDPQLYCTVHIPCWSFR